MSVRRTAVAAALVMATGVAVAHAVTDGFEAYTLEAARRLAALNSPAPVPDLVLDIAQAASLRLRDLPEPVLLVDFLYASCPAYCAALGSVYAQLQQRLAPEITAGTVRLVSITFDPARDGPAELVAYRERFSAGAEGWVLGRPAQPGDLPRWLDAFGVVVIPDGQGGYAHNAAIHVVGPERRLVAIHGLEDLETVVTTARRIAGAGAAHVAAR